MLGVCFFLSLINNGLLVVFIFFLKFQFKAFSFHIRLNNSKLSTCCSNTLHCRWLQRMKMITTTSNSEGGYYSLYKRVGQDLKKIMKICVLNEKNKIFLKVNHFSSSSSSLQPITYSAYVNEFKKGIFNIFADKILMEIYVINYLEDSVKFHNGTLFVLLRGYSGSRENVNKSLLHDIKFPIILLSYPWWLRGRNIKEHEVKIESMQEKLSVNYIARHTIYSRCKCSSR